MMKVKKTIKPRLPSDIELLENVLLPNGTLFIKLPTLALLEKFWEENCNRFAYAVVGNELDEDQDFLNSCEWVFGNSKTAVVETVCRWTELGITAKFYEWVKEEPDDPFLCARNQNAANLIAEKQVTEPSILATWAPENFRGYWKLHKLPLGYNSENWFASEHDEISDWTLPISVVSEMFKEHTFDDWRNPDSDAVTAFNNKEIGEYVQYWQTERESGKDYYGIENEIAD